MVCVRTARHFWNRRRRNGHVSRLHSWHVGFEHSCAPRGRKFPTQTACSGHFPVYTFCNPQQHTAAHRNTLQRTATREIHGFQKVSSTHALEVSKALLNPKNCVFFSSNFLRSEIRMREFLIRGKKKCQFFMQHLLAASSQGMDLSHLKEAAKHDGTMYIYMYLYFYIMYV